MTDKRLQYLILVLLHLTIATVPLYFKFNTEELFEFNKVLLVYLFASLLGGIWISRSILAGKLLYARKVFDFPVSIFLLSQFIATLFSIHPRTSWLGYYTRFHGGLLSYLAYATLYTVASQTLEKKHLKPLLVTMLASSAIVSIYGILEHFGHSPSCFILTDGQAFDASCWIQDVQNRVFATFGQPNWLAAYVVLLLPVATWFAIRTQSKMQTRMFGIIMVVLLYSTLLFTKSRSGFLGIFTALVCSSGYMGLYLTTKWNSAKKRTALFQSVSLPHGAIVFLLIFGLSVGFGTPFSPSISTSITKNQTSQSEPVAQPSQVVNRLDEGGTDSGEIRKIVWTGALAVWKRYPLLGSGVETFAYSYYQDRPVNHNIVSEWDFLYNKAHNEVLNFFATSGIVGGLAYILLVASIFFFTAKQVLRDTGKPDEIHVLVALTSGVAALTVSNFFGFSTVAVSLLWFVYLSISAVLITTTAGSANIPTEKTRRQDSANALAHSFSAQVLLIGIVGIIVLVLWGMVYRTYAADTAYARGKQYFATGDFTNGTTSIQQAISLSPKEALYYDELAHQFAKTAVDIASEEHATSASELASTAILLSDTALSLNPQHLNFYKTRARVFITLAQLQPKLLAQAKETLEAAINRAPTDAKLVYNLALVELGLGNTESSQKLLETAVSLKPNYGAARIELAKLAIELGQVEMARDNLEYILTNINPNDTQSKQLLESVATLSAKPMQN